MSTTQPPTPANAAPETHPSAVLVTPHGTPVVLPGPAPAPVLSPEMASLLTAALNTLPPGAIPTLLKKYWGYVMVALVPLLLTTYQNVKEIWSGPATIAAVTESAKKDHEEVEGLKKKVEAIDGKIDKVLWILNQRPGSPTSGPI